jgi:hypothetical protein
LPWHPASIGMAAFSHYAYERRAMDIYGYLFGYSYREAASPVPANRDSTSG